jgi:hypothetical protein
LEGSVTSTDGKMEGWDRAWSPEANPFSSTFSPSLESRYFSTFPNSCLVSAFLSLFCSSPPTLQGNSLSGQSGLILWTMSTSPSPFSRPPSPEMASSSSVTVPPSTSSSTLSFPKIILPTPSTLAATSPRFEFRSLAFVRSVIGEAKKLASEFSSSSPEKGARRRLRFSER